MRRLHLGCHLEDHDLDTSDCHCVPEVSDLIDEDGREIRVVVHVDLT